MNAEDFLDAVGGIDKELIAEAEESGGTGLHRGRIRTWIKAAAAAACLGLALFAAFRFLRPDSAVKNKTDPESAPSAEATLQAPTEPALPKTLSEEKRAALTSAVQRHAAAEETVQAFLTENVPDFQTAGEIVTFLPIGTRIWAYGCRFGPQFFKEENTPEPEKSLNEGETGRMAEAVIISQNPPKWASQLEELKGDLFLELKSDSEKETRNWYRVKDLPELKYLILDEAGGLSLWEFKSLFRSDTDADHGAITYGELFQLIYGLDRADEIWQITAVAPTANGTQLGQEIQREIGTQTIEDPALIAAFYGIIKDLAYNSGNPPSWNYSRFTYSFTTEAQGSIGKLDSGESIRGGRYISLTLADGVTIDSLKYDTLSGMIYEWGGITPAELTDEQVAVLNGIFGIR